MRNRLASLRRKLAIGLEIISSWLIVAGIGIEVLTGGEAGYIIISVGSVGIVAGGILYGRIFIK